MTSLPMIFPLLLTGVGFFWGGGAGGAQGNRWVPGQQTSVVLLLRNRKLKHLWKNIQNFFSRATVFANR